MCDRSELLEKLTKYQVKPDPVVCTCDSQCWCNELSFRHPMTQIQDECMSPAEMLKIYKTDLSKKDIKYLKGLLAREFIPN